MKENTHREPTLYIVGNKERADEIKNILENELEGSNSKGFEFYDCRLAYFVNSCGIINCERLEDIIDSIKNGWMKEFKLPEKQQLKPFDKVVARFDKGSVWFACLYSNYQESGHHVLINNLICRYCLPYNEQTEKLIGTTDEWKGGNND